MIIEWVRHYLTLNMLSVSRRRAHKDGQARRQAGGQAGRQEEEGRFL